MGRGGRPAGGGADAGGLPLSRAKIRSARAVAVAVLRDIERRSGFSNRVLCEHLERGPALSSRDRGLTTHLVYGVLRHRARLDRHIDARANRPAKIKGEVREVLRMAALELLELGHPPHAAISEAAKLIAVLDRSGRLRSMVHAITAGIAREGAALDAALGAAAPLRAMVDRWSIPEWIATRWLSQLGAEAALQRARRLAAPPRVDLRVVTAVMSRAEALAKLTADHPGAQIEAPSDNPDALRVQGAGDLFFGPLFDAGALVVQGLASQDPVRMLGIAAGESVLDACAGMGTKSRQLADALGRGRLVAADASATRLTALEHTMTRFHPDTALFVAQGDLREAVAEVDTHAPFDAVLLDAPCTGLGNLARHPEIRWTRKPQDVAERSTVQASLLTRCLDRVRPGGRLVYAVCSSEPEEGPAMVRRVLASLPEATRPTLVDERHRSPEADDTDGFYSARLNVADNGSVRW